nr:site-specific integrase [uncultured Anaeromusa sp.]
MASSLSSSVILRPWRRGKYSEQAIRYMTSSKAVNTIRAYQSDWDDFSYWCRHHGYAELPATPETLVEYFSYLADFIKANTISRKATAISEAHKAAGCPSPTLSADVRMTLQGIRKAKGTFQQGKSPVMWSDLAQVSDVFDPTPLGIRNRALILFGFAGAFRRSELVALDVEDLTFFPEGVKVFLGKAKNDPDGKGQYKGISYRRQRPEVCPVRAIKAWLDISGLTSGPLFRSLTKNGGIRQQRLSDKAVARTVKEFAERTGADPQRYAGHSLRRGFATSAALAGARERHIMKQTGHHSDKMVRRYIEESEIFSFDNMALMEKADGTVKGSDDYE